MELKYYIKTRDTLEQNWHTKVKFTVIIYDGVYFEDILLKKLRDNGFNVIKLSDITEKNLLSPEYISSDYHPTPAAWELLTPLIAKNL